MLFDENVLDNIKWNGFGQNQNSKLGSFARHFSLLDDDFSEIYKFIDDLKANQFDTDLKVVSIFGESTAKTSDSKCEIVRSLFGKTPLQSSVNSTLFKNESSQIDGIYDADNRVVILYLTSMFDYDLFLKASRKHGKDAMNFKNPELSHGMYRSLLVLFQLSHVIICHYSSMRFDHSRLKLFKILHSFCPKFTPILEESCKKTVPSLLFSFDTVDFQEDFNGLSIQDYNFLVKQMQDQILQVLENESFLHQTNPLFTLSDSNHFVQFYPSDNSARSLITSYLEKSSQIDAQVFFNSLEKLKKLILCEDPQEEYRERIEGCNAVLSSLLDVDARFSEKICQTMIVQALKCYNEGLPEYYNLDAHLMKKQAAVQWFAQVSKGSAIKKYTEMLEAECDSIWSKGHRMCEALSLTGLQCSNRTHQLPNSTCYSSGSNETETLSSSSEELPVMEHTSGVKYLSACNCGRRQGKRSDPFSVKAANSDFYLKMKFNCRTCRVIEHIKFPVVTDGDFEVAPHLGLRQRGSAAATANDVGGDVASGDKATTPSDDDADEPYEEEEEEEEDDYEEESDKFSQETYDSDSVSAAYDGKGEGDELMNDHEGTPEVNDFGENDSERGESNEAKFAKVSAVTEEIDEFCFNDQEEAINEKANSNIDARMKSSLDVSSGGSPKVFRSRANIDLSKFPSMLLHNRMAPGTLARFSSWSLVKLGSATVYSHDKGIKDQQGFVGGSNYLMPWNVRVVLKHKRGVALWNGKQPAGVKNKKSTRGGTQFTVKLFLGTEYECLKGHRFICSGPNQILRRQTEKKVKDNKITADSIASSDMPVYMHCMCHKDDAPSIAQLMRLHVVTPKVPVRVTLNPFVRIGSTAQPTDMTQSSSSSSQCSSATAAASTTFYPGQSAPIELEQASYWVMRLPLIYETESGPIRFPRNDAELPTDLCLLKDCYGIAGVSDVG